MSRRATLVLVGFLLVVVTPGFLFVAMISYQPGRREVTQNLRPPELGGQVVPDAIHDIRFDRAYDLHCVFDRPTTFVGCKIIGFTGRGKNEARAQDFSGLSVASSYHDRNSFDHWLVLERPDGRLVFIPPESVRYIEETAAKTDAQNPPRETPGAR